MTVQSKRNHITVVAEREDPRGRPYYWIEEGQNDWEPHDRSDYQAVRDADGKWFEPVVANDAVVPANLHQAQLERRQSGRGGRATPAARRDSAAILPR